MDETVLDKVVSRFVQFLTGKSQEEYNFDKKIKSLKKDLISAELPLIDEDDFFTINLAIHFYKIYKLMLPYKTILKQSLMSDDPARNALFLNIVINELMDSNQRHLLKNCSKENIIRLYNEHKNITIVNNHIDKNFTKFIRSMDIKIQNSVNLLLRSIVIFYNIASFDFVTFFRFFDKNFKAGNYKPIFSKIESFKPVDYLTDFYYLINFPELSFSITQALKGLNDKVKIVKELNFEKINSDLTVISTILNEYINKEIIRTLILIGQKDKKINISKTRESFFDFEEYKKGLKEHIESIRSRTMLSVKKNEIEKLSTMIFRNVTISSIRHYTAEKNNTFIRFKLKKFKHIMILPIIKTFLIFYFEPKLKPIFNKIIISGYFSDSETQKKLSDLYYRIPAIQQDISEFEKIAAPEGRIGKEIEKFLPTLGEGKYSEKLLNTSIDELNNAAFSVFCIAAQIFNEFTGIFTEITQDFNNKKPETLLNIITLIGPQETVAGKGLINLYKVTYLFNKILKNHDYIVKLESDL